MNSGPWLVISEKSEWCEGESERTVFSLDSSYNVLLVEVKGRDPTAWRWGQQTIIGISQGNSG